ncbi:hypothetical protein GGS20DRAFT_509789 [Poronia punctata]|nr:hypothetical protein GGS20DRAFT_509789 [Poronia punctata]
MMEIDEEEILRSLVAGGSMDYLAWPVDLYCRANREGSLSRLWNLRLPREALTAGSQIAHEEFPIPNLPPPPPAPRLLPPTTVPSSIPQARAADISENALPALPALPSSPTDPHTASSSPDTNKENKPIVPPSTVAPPPSTSAPVSSTPLPPGTLPPQIASMLSEVTSYLSSTFTKYPPHTIQRISELVVTPKQHYKSVISYLHALDRVVHVTSGINIYPLPATFTEVPGSMSNGVLDTSVRPSSWAAPGSDEALGGALLTPIPWVQHNHRAMTSSPSPEAQATALNQDAPAELEGEVRTESTETIDGPNGVGSIETVSVSVNGIPSMGARGIGVTQGELLRQEQRAGVVPVSQLVPSHHVQTGSNASAAAQQQQQQQIQARIQQQHQRALAQSQIQPRISSSEESPDSPSSATDAASSTTPSSATLEAESTDAAAAANDDDDDPAVKISSVHSNNPDEDEKPHACGPENIGADDVGPQSVTTSSLSSSGAASGMMQGIDLQAAVGRKAMDVSSSASKDEDGKDKDVVAVGEEQQQPKTPKRDAEDDHSEAPASKKVKEDPAGDTKMGEANEESKETDAMVT